MTENKHKNMETKTTEKRNTGDAPLKLLKKIMEIQRGVTAIVKDSESGALEFKNGKMKNAYSYASSVAVLNRIRPLMDEHGVLLLSDIISETHEQVEITKTVLLENRTAERYKVRENLFRLDIRFTWLDAESGETLTNDWVSYGMNGQEKGIGSALTYGKRYYLLQFFNIPTPEDDPDAMEKKEAQAPIPEETPAPSPAQTQAPAGGSRQPARLQKSAEQAPAFRPASVPQGPYAPDPSIMARLMADPDYIQQIKRLATIPRQLNPGKYVMARQAAAEYFQRLYGAGENEMAEMDRQADAERAKLPAGIYSR